MDRGGGSGRGFKNGPAMGEYVASIVARGAPPEKLFALGYKPKAAHLGGIVNDCIADPC
jgi:glycine/D-amino acid oxidase-like deaminating enzyme